MFTFSYHLHYIKMPNLHRMSIVCEWWSHDVKILRLILSIIVQNSRFCIMHTSKTVKISSLMMFFPNKQFFPVQLRVFTCVSKTFYHIGLIGLKVQNKSIVLIEPLQSNMKFILYALTSVCIMKYLYRIIYKRKFSNEFNCWWQGATFLLNIWA